MVSRDKSAIHHSLRAGWKIKMALLGKQERLGGAI